MDTLKKKFITSQKITSDFFTSLSTEDLAKLAKLHGIESKEDICSILADLLEDKRQLQDKIGWDSGYVIDELYPTSDNNTYTTSISTHLQEFEIYELDSDEKPKLVLWSKNKML